MNPGHGTGDLFLEIDYSFAFDSDSPRFTFSNTPGFGEAEWAFGGGPGFPQAWDRFNNMHVVQPFQSDHYLQEEGMQEQLQLMIGLPASVSYDHVEVELVAARDVRSGILNLDVENPLTGCGVSDVTISNEDAFTSTIVDLADCLEPGESVQAVRLTPQSGILDLLRMRVTLKGASW